jgi:hypothetical protein
LLSARNFCSKFRRNQSVSFTCMVRRLNSRRFGCHLPCAHLKAGAAGDAAGLVAGAGVSAWEPLLWCRRLSFGAGLQHVRVRRRSHLMKTRAHPS